MKMYGRPQRPQPIVPSLDPPRRVIMAMVAGDAVNDEAVGEPLRIVRIRSLDSAAWRVYRDWACSVGKGKVGPLVQAVIAPTLEIMQSQSSPTPPHLAFPIVLEANSMITHMGHFTMDDDARTLPGPVDDPGMMAKIQDAGVAVTSLIEAISNPPTNYPAIKSLDTGAYVCHVEYCWYSVDITVPVFRS